MIWKKMGRLSKSQLLSKSIPVQILEKHQLIMTKIEKNQRKIDVLDHVIVQDRTGLYKGWDTRFKIYSRGDSKEKKRRRRSRSNDRIEERRLEREKQREKEKEAERLRLKTITIHWFTQFTISGIDEDVKEKKLKENAGMKIEDEKLKDEEGCLPARHSEKDLEVEND